MAQRARRTRSIRLGDLEQQIQAAARTAGQGVSEWIRAAIEAALRMPSAAADAEVAPAHSTDRARVTIRTTRDNADRWRAEAAEQGVSLVRYIELQLMLTRESRYRVAQALAELREDAVASAALSQKLSALNRRLNGWQHDLTEDDRREIGLICATTDAIKSSSARLVRAMAQGERQRGVR